MSWKLNDEERQDQVLDTTLRDALIKQMAWMKDARVNIYTKEPLPRVFSRYLSKIGREQNCLVAFHLT